MRELCESVSSLRGVGASRVSRLKKMGIYTLEDLLFFFPRRYEDRRDVKSLDDLVPGNIESARAKVVSVEETVSSVKKMNITRALVSDGSAMSSAIWFNRRGLKSLLSHGTEIALHGRVENSGGLTQFMAPEFEILGEGSLPGIIECIVPVYPLTAGLTDMWMRKTLKKALNDILPSLKDPLPESVLNEFELCEASFALSEMHNPTSPDHWKMARKRLAFEELFTLQLGLAMRQRISGQDQRALSFSDNTELQNKVQKLFSFNLTADQVKVISEISSDISGNVPMNRLLQGDVGSGKTAVAIMAMMQVVGGGGQAALMVPTSVLAQQHYLKISSLLGSAGVQTVILTGGLSTSQRKDTLQLISSGEANVIIGTHALIQEGVDFHCLGLIVIDEQHRFGVLQRSALSKKGNRPHTLIMTATPIPRTLALSVYGDLAVSTIKSMPVGRLPVKTRWIPEHRLDDLYGFMETEMARGRRVFWICPIIEESEVLQVRPLEERFEFLKERFGDDKVALLHGRMAMEERKSAMESFVDGSRPLVASTTVVEVGVDVSEATVMVVENSERFGLSQLHQLRGRVGRSDEQSWCFLLGKPKTDEGRTRIRVLCSSSDGFEVAEEDMKLRGPGQLCGVKQHGLTDFKVADLVRDGKLLDLAREKAFDMVENDEDLSQYPELKSMVIRQYGERLNLVGTA